MKVFNYSNNELNNVEKLYNALKIDIKEKNIISVVGAGGKTRIIYALAEEFGMLNKKVIVTTTTHMFMPKDNVILSGKVEDIENALNKLNVVTVGMPSGKEKIKSVKDKLLEGLINIADIVIIEADGSKRLPLKAPASYEPVIFKDTNLVIGVAGIDSLEKTIASTCHRPEVVSSLLEVDVNHIITAIDIAKVLSSKDGQRKDVYCKYKVVINKADNKENLLKAVDISEELCKLGIDETIITTFI